MLNVLIANLPYLLKGAIVTLWLSLIVVTLGTGLGTIVGLWASVGGWLVRALVTAYIFVLRGIPVLVVMLLGYYAFPALGLRSSAYVAAPCCRCRQGRSPPPRASACGASAFCATWCCRRQRGSPLRRCSTIP